MPLHAEGVVKVAQTVASTSILRTWALRSSQPKIAGDEVRAMAISTYADTAHAELHRHYILARVQKSIDSAMPFVSFENNSICQRFF